MKLLKILKNSTYDELILKINTLCNRNTSLKVDLLREKEKSDYLDKQLLSSFTGIRDLRAEIASLKPKSEKWDAELKRQRDKQKRKREKVKLQSGIEKFVTKNLGLKMEVCGSVGHICGYNKNENMIIVGFENNNDSNLKWTESAINENDTLLMNHNFYMAITLDINTKIIK